ncbi:MAG: class I SAM-dependent methyltransferase [Victivallales bacterium]|nr:class I SAM-dependent methyltransferase [Victivallales bacterium]
MRDYSIQNKKAWEFNAYDFWVKTAGTPEEMAKKNLENPQKMLRKYAKYFDKIEGIKVANICGSCGKKAIPLALLGADVTVFDISEHNKRYAMEVANAANVKLNYEVCDVLDIDLKQYGGYFDVVFMEGGILHYFHDIDVFMKKMNAILKPGGKMICSDFHPFTKIMDTLGFQWPSMNYFSTDVFEGEMAHARFFDDETRKKMPKCSYRKYTISEIINSMIRNGFMLKQFDEHPSWENETLPGEFTAIGIKQ